MSNHSGGYMLNNVIGVMAEAKVFELLGREKSRKMIVEIVKMASNEYDCNHGEILEGHTDHLQLCYYCLSAATNLSDGICDKCDESEE
jgi:hypothetical protein